MKAILLLTTALAGYVAIRAITGDPSAPIAPSTPPPSDVADVTRRFLMNIVLPVWLASGIADWLCHRAASIETTSGAKESLMHLLMLTEAAIPVLGGMFLEITSPVLALMLVSMLLHDATALWDVSYAISKRTVTPVEQHVHSFLEMVPVMAVSFISILRWPQVLALFGIGRSARTGAYAGNNDRCPGATRRRCSARRWCWGGCPTWRSWRAISRRTRVGA